MNKSNIRKSKKSILKIVLFTVLLLYSAFMIFFLGWGLLTSFKSATEFLLRPMDKGGPNIFGLPDIKFSKEVAEVLGQEYSLLDNYKYILKSLTIPINTKKYTSIFGEITQSGGYVGFGESFFNTIFYAGFCGAISVFTCLAMAYACNKFKYKYSSIMYTTLLVAFTIPIVGTQGTSIQLVKDLGIYNTRLSMVIMSINAMGMYFFVFYGFFSGFSDTYGEAAEIDGASQWVIFIKIVLPLSSKMFFSVFILQFVALWNGYENTMLYYPSLPTLSYSIYRMSFLTSGEGIGFVSQSAPQRIAGCMFLAIPVFVFFLFFRKTIMGNITMGGIKG